MEGSSGFFFFLAKQQKTTSAERKKNRAAPMKKKSPIHVRIPKNFLLPTCFIVPKKKKRERKRDEVLFVWVKRAKIRVEEKNR